MAVPNTSRGKEKTTRLDTIHIQQLDDDSDGRSKLTDLH